VRRAETQLTNVLASNRVAQKRRVVSQISSFPPSVAAAAYVQLRMGGCLASQLDFFSYFGAFLKKSRNKSRQNLFLRSHLVF
jgi:hypothetical protein